MAIALDLSGTVALVTGASRGLGQAIAMALASAGADLALAARTMPDLRRTAEAAAAHGIRAEVFSCDVRKPEDIRTLVEGTVASFGRIDVLVNNAGISGTEKACLDLEAEDWEDTLAVDLTGPALLAKAAGRVMAGQRRGRIINIASLAATRAIPYLGPYCASKAALVQLTRVMALELARHNVQVNAICPGYFATPMNEHFFATPQGQEIIRRTIPMRRLGQPEELGPIVVFLASDAAKFMTGSVIAIDGGQALT